MTKRLITAIEIDGAGEDPSAWRGAEVDPAEILAGALALRAVQRAEAAGIDLATFVDTLEAPADVPAQVSVRLEALGLAARIAPATDRIGLLPTVAVTHTEPFHLQASVATLDHISSGRGGWIADVSTSAEAAAVIGRREPAPAADIWREARYVADVSKRLWDSWEDDAIIRDASTGRFIDRDRIHYVDFESPNFSVKGPSIVPRPPQGHPVTAVRVRSPEALQVAADAELVFLPGGEGLADRLAAVRSAGSARVLVSVSVRPHVDGVEGLVDLIAEWADAGVDGVHLRPASLELDVPVIADQLLPALRDRGLVAPLERAGTLRSRLGLRRPENRYATRRA
jgi:alkanesulfonate monooxygenase SsuD/methylene tetrahydromethanopterin reductase-like flavin-dependent oxidoreductase (luciferase family)